jgi:phosphatidylinositol-3,4,5-trisphosphate 3-phosphatase/dual-specificity protein phosphatase PTEN
MKKIRELVSRDKLRFREEGYDLDLTYITNNVIAMGIPGEKTSKLWRNDINEVSRFLKTKHDNHFMIYNLSGLTYDYTKFNGRVKEFGFPDHHTPRLDYLWKIVATMDEYTRQDPLNVAAVHCLAGRGEILEEDASLTNI